MDAEWPPAARRNTDDWRRWRGRVWPAVTSRQRPHLGTDGPTFASLTAAPALQARCAERWPAFRRWWPPAKQVIVAALSDPHVLDATRGVGRDITLHVVPLRAAQTLATLEIGDGSTHQLVSIGLVTDPDRLRILLQSGS